MTKKKRPINLDRSKGMGFRMTPQQYDYLTKRAIKLSTTKGDIVRQLIDEKGGIK